LPGVPRGHASLYFGGKSRGQMVTSAKMLVRTAQRRGAVTRNKRIPRILRALAYLLMCWITMSKWSHRRTEAAGVASGGRRCHDRVHGRVHVLGCGRPVAY
jgi:hypothetical protein